MSPPAQGMSTRAIAHKSIYWEEPAMALDSSNVRVAVTGAWYVAPVGTPGPTAADSELDLDFIDLGYLGDGGTTKSTSRSTSDIIGWQNAAKLRTVVTEAGVTFQFVLVETKIETVELYTGATVDEDGTVDVDPAATGGRRAFVFDVIDGDDVQRIWIPEGEVTEIGDQNFVSGDAVGYDVTVAAYSSSEIDGKAYRHFNPSLVDES